MIEAFFRGIDDRNDGNVNNGEVYGDEVEEGDFSDSGLGVAFHLPLDFG